MINYVITYLMLSSSQIKTPSQLKNVEENEIIRPPHVKENIVFQPDNYVVVVCRVSSETSFVSKQPKLEPKLVSALSETRRLLRLFLFNIETGSFGVSKQPKQTKDQSKQQQIC